MPLVFGLVLAALAATSLVPVPSAAALAPARPAAPLHLHMPGVSPAVARYTIVDLGTYSTVNQNHPVALNNNGDILGYVLDAKFSCVIWNGTRLVDVTAADSVKNCSGAQIADVGPTGAFTFTGSLQYAIEDSGVGFVASMKPNAAGASAFASLTKTSASTIIGIDAAGTALMKGYYAGVFDGTVPFAVTGSAPALLQPQCVGTDLRYCMTLDYFAGSCPFGKCYLSSGGLVLAYDESNLNLMTYRLGSPHSARDLPIHQPNYATMNDKEQIAYDQYDSADHRHAYVFDTKTGTHRLLPAVAGDSCDYQVISQNNVGSVLGLATDCTKEGQFYVLWDAAGVHNLAQSIPANTYFSIALLGVNDHGLILAEFLKVNAQDVLEYHWGFLK